MPLRKVKGGWTFGGAVYKSKAAAERAYRAYLAKKHQPGETFMRTKR